MAGLNSMKKMTPSSDEMNDLTMKMLREHLSTWEMINQLQIDFTDELNRTKKQWQDEKAEMTAKYESDMIASGSRENYANVQLNEARSQIIVLKTQLQRARIDLYENEDDVDGCKKRKHNGFWKRRCQN